MYQSMMDDTDLVLILSTYPVYSRKEFSVLRVIVG